MLSDECRIKRNAYMRSWTSRNRDKVSARNKKYKEENPEKCKASLLKSIFGISLEEYKQLYEMQNGVCAICKQPETAKHQSGKFRSLAVDHCHASQKVRGLLCTPCNTALGLLQESKDTALNLIEYLDKEK